MGYYDTAQICENGHAITAVAGTSPEFQKKFCTKCGAPTVTACQHCNAPLRGRYHQEGVCDMRRFRLPIPTFCHECGKAFPWTEQRVAAFHELTAELDELTKDDQEKLNASLDDLMQAGPKTDLATHRFKKVAAKLGKDSYELLKKLSSDILSEAIKKSVFGT